MFIGQGNICSLAHEHMFIKRGDLLSQIHHTSNISHPTSSLFSHFWHGVGKPLASPKGLPGLAKGLRRVCQRFAKGILFHLCCQQQGRKNAKPLSCHQAVPVVVRELVFDDIVTKLHSPDFVLQQNPQRLIEIGKIHIIF